MTRVRIRSLALLVATAALLTACSTPAEPGATPSRPPSPSASDVPAAEPTPTVEAPAADPTCETIIPTEVVDDFADAGWTSQADVFRIGATEVPDGLECVWGDFSIASDHVQIFGWAPIQADLAAAAQDDLLTQGWRRQDGEDGVYITEDPSMAISTDEDGFGMTYLFGDGWVTVSDTKQGLLLVTWPPAA